MKTFLNHLDNTFGLLFAGIVCVSILALTYALFFIAFFAICGALGGMLEGIYTAIDMLWEGISLFF